MKKLIAASVAVAALVMASPGARAAVVSINDEGESLSLSVNKFNQITHAGDLPPGSGNPVDITTPTPSNGVSAIHYTLTGPAVDPTLESLSFTFANQVNWSANTYWYRFYTEEGASGYSDLFVIQGLAGTAPDYISFLSTDSFPTGCSSTDPAAIAACVESLVPVLPNSSATPLNLGTQAENGWQLAADTGVDQYFIISAPEPGTLALLGVGLLGIGFVRRKRG